MNEGGEIPIQNPGKPASKASYGDNRMRTLLGHYADDGAADEE